MNAHTTETFNRLSGAQKIFALLIHHARQEKEISFATMGHIEDLIGSAGPALKEMLTTNIHFPGEPGESSLVSLLIKNKHYGVLTCLVENLYDLLITKTGLYMNAPLKPSGYTPAHVAIMHGDPMALLILQEAECDILRGVLRPMKDEGEPLLDYAIRTTKNPMIFLVFAEAMIASCMKKAKKAREAQWQQRMPDLSPRLRLARQEGNAAAILMLEDPLLYCKKMEEEYSFPLAQKLEALALRRKEQSKEVRRGRKKAPQPTVKSTPATPDEKLATLRLTA